MYLENTLALNLKQYQLINVIEKCLHSWSVYCPERIICGKLQRQKKIRGILQRVILCKAKLSLCSKLWVEWCCILLQKIHKNT